MRFARNLWHVFWWTSVVVVIGAGAILSLTSPTKPDPGFYDAVIWVLCGLPVSIALIAAARGRDIKAGDAGKAVGRFFAYAWAAIWISMMWIAIIAVAAFVLFGAIGILVFGLKQIF